MSILYGLLILMLVSALSLLAVPFIANKSLLSRGFIIIAILTTLFSLTVYRIFGNHQALEEWFSAGEQHYQLLVTLDQLGGVNGVITRIKKKLENNPDDAEGWFILGKLYLANQNYTEAKAALSKAHALQPQNEQINHFYEIAETARWKK